MKKRYIISLIIVVALFLFFGLMKKTKNAPKYLVEPIGRNTIVQVVEASGTINPVTTVNIGSQVSGLIKEIYVDFNSQVKKGQLLAQIDTSLFEAQLQQSLANIANAKANYQKISAIMENDKKTYNRYKNLYARNFIAKSELDLAESTYFSDIAQLDAAKAQISQAEASYKTASANMRYTKIISPVDGTVVSRNVDVGQTVAASFQTPTLFMVAQDLTKMQIETSVSEADIGKVQVGQDVNYTLDGYQDSVFHGKVTQVRISPTTVQNVVTYTVIVDVLNEDGKLIPGMTANVSIITSKKENIMTVPNAALKFTPNTDGSGPKYKEQGIWIMENRRPKRVNIVVGVSDDVNTEISTQELKGNEQVIVGFEDSKKNKNRSGRPPVRMF
ncbi:efflux RND transporter periplasmic adaptor subunit [bacterium]|nr:efflux RND transporter periplasmic adaptor subunit [bacterium]